MNTKGGVTLADKLCPFRKVSSAPEAENGLHYEGGDFYREKVEFQPCLGERCALAVAIPAFDMETWELDDKGTAVRTNVQPLAPSEVRCALMVAAEALKEACKPVAKG